MISTTAKGQKSKEEEEELEDKFPKWYDINKKSFDFRAWYIVNDEVKLTFFSPSTLYV